MSYVPARIECDIPQGSYGESSCEREVTRRFVHAGQIWDTCERCAANCRPPRWVEITSDSEIDDVIKVSEVSPASISSMGEIAKHLAAAIDAELVRIYGP